VILSASDINSVYVTPAGDGHDIIDVSECVGRGAGSFPHSHFLDLLDLNHHREIRTWTSISSLSSDRG
jgi:hypothetical protein